jgi:lipopolysaccharide export system protein LptC
MQVRFPPSLFPLLLLGLLAGMTYWLELASRPPNGGNDGKLRHDPDYLVENFEVRRYGPEGALQHTLRATLMKHFPDDDSTTVTAPDLTYHRTPPTRITAREAWLDGKGEHVQLIDNVHVARSGIAGKPETVLVTSHLHAYPDEEIATTSVPVTITQGRSVVNGSRMHANNKTALYVLEGPVRGIFHRKRATAAPPLAWDEAPPAAETRQKPKPRPQAKAKPKKRTSR